MAFPAFGQDGFFSLIDEDKRYEIIFNLGPSFIRDPVFKTYNGADGIHPATRISLSTPRYLSGAWSLRLNNWLRVEASLVFNAADFKDASPADAAAEAMFRENVENNILCGDAPFDYNACNFGSIYESVQSITEAIYNSRDSSDGRIDEAEAEMIDEVARVAARGVHLSPDRDEYSAEGTFLNLSGFLGAYADIQLAGGFWIYGGGGGGIAWSHVKDGQYRRQSYFNLDIDALEDSIAAEAPDALTEVELSNLTRNLPSVHSRFQESFIASTETSLAFTAQAGFRSEIFDDLVLDSGYQMIWTQDLYENADAQIIHMVRIGLVFNY